MSAKKPKKSRREPTATTLAVGEEQEHFPVPPGLDIKPIDDDNDQGPKRPAGNKPSGRTRHDENGEG